MINSESLNSDESVKVLNSLHQFDVTQVGTHLHRIGTVSPAARGVDPLSGC